MTEECACSACSTEDLEVTVVGSGGCTMLTCETFPYDWSHQTWQVNGGAWAVTMSCTGKRYTVTVGFGPFACGGTGWLASFEESSQGGTAFAIERTVGPVPPGCLPFGCGGQNLTVTIQKSCT